MSRPRLRRKDAAAVAAAFYVACALIADTLAAQGVQTPLDWTVLRWRGPLAADLFKFAAWFCVPFALSLPWLDVGWFSLRRWRRADWFLLGGIVVAGAAAMALIPFVPSLRETYGSASGLSPEQKWSMLIHSLVWTVSWLVGWEFMHRYFLLRPVSNAWPRYGWLLVPVFETVYHLQKPLLEAGGMLLFSVVLTYWAIKRRNLMLPLIAHLIIELELIAFRLLF